VLGFLPQLHQGPASLASGATPQQRCCRSAGSTLS